VEWAVLALAVPDAVAEDRLFRTTIFACLLHSVGVSFLGLEILPCTISRDVVAGYLNFTINVQVTLFFV